jgi:hypothetical protein
MGRHVTHGKPRRRAERPGNSADSVRESTEPPPVMLAWVDVSEQTSDAGEPEPAEEAARQARHASRSLRNGLISLALLVVLVVGLLLAIPGLNGVCGPR